VSAVTPLPRARARAFDERRFPPVAEVATAALVLIVVGGIYMASYSPRRPPLTVPTVLAAASAALVLGALVMLTRARGLAWDKFFLVGRWTLVSYVIAAGLIEFAFVKDHLRGGPLALVTAMLVLFALIVPLIISFTVARYQSPRPDTA
jgi:polyferredoxin